MDDLEDPEALLNRFIACESISNNEAEYAALLAEVLRAEGYRVELDASHNVYAFDPEAPLQVAFSTHIDTVPPFFPARREGELIYGRGACDTKGGLVAMLHAARALRREGFQGLGFVLVVCEETDHSGARTAAARADLQAAKPHIILCEPTRNRLATAQKGVLKLRLRATGKAAHSAYPERGFSAIHILIDALARVRALDWPSDPILGPTTCNVGLISGGVAANVFAPEAEATLMIRLTRPEGEVRAALAPALEGLEVATLSANDPVVYDPPEGFETCIVSFNTDASILSELGPVWLAGPGDIEVAHSDHEHISLTSLNAGIDLYVELARAAARSRGGQ